MTSSCCLLSRLYHDKYGACDNFLVSMTPNHMFVHVNCLLLKRFWKRFWGISYVSQAPLTFPNATQEEFSCVCLYLFCVWILEMLFSYLIYLFPSAVSRPIQNVIPQYWNDVMYFSRVEVNPWWCARERLTIIWTCLAEHILIIYLRLASAKSDTKISYKTSLWHAVQQLEWRWWKWIVSCCEICASSGRISAPSIRLRFLNVKPSD